MSSCRATNAKGLKATIGTRTVTISAFTSPGTDDDRQAKPQRRPLMGTKVSTDQSHAMQGAFDHFNVELFDGELPPVILNFSRHANCFGFFAPDRWFDADGETVAHEISINPMHLRSRDLRSTYSTLVHEMVHLWQNEFGHRKAKRGYHNNEWANKMEAVGLLPTDTGVPGGSRTGYKVTHMVIDGAAYDRAFESMADDHKLPWLCEEPLKEPKKRKRSKVKFTCRVCETNAWAKPGASLKCGDCDEGLDPEPDPDDDDLGEGDDEGAES